MSDDPCAKERQECHNASLALSEAWQAMPVADTPLSKVEEAKPEQAAPWMLANERINKAEARYKQARAAWDECRKRHKRRS